MPMYNVGFTIKEFRKRKSITQESLCEGLCEPSTLSKIESGRQNPTKKLLEALMSRLGSPITNFNIPVSQTEFQRGQIEREIASSFANFDYDIKELLDEYESCSPEMDKLEKQFYLFSYAVAFFRKNNTDKKLEMLLDSMRQTFPDYKVGIDFSSHFLTVFELIILNNISLSLYKLNKKDEALNLLIKVEEYLSSHEIEREEFAKQYPIVINNLVGWLAHDKDFEKARSFAQKGIDCCIKYGKLSPLPILAYNLGYVLISLEEVEEGIEYVKEAISLLKLMKRNDTLELVISDIKKCFGEDFLKKI